MEVNSFRVEPRSLRTGTGSYHTVGDLSNVEADGSGMSRKHGTAESCLKSYLFARYS
ncbi:hypothetical protein [Sphingobacterium chuzhouense]|uniref:Uncharacterized protein n=1 Tax=Sphingobacterium chuzhouense TaxID=1742264 RepID=A0ABR7XUQ7_9SPHI|nr:hypothetical protein [Sphingobacterium chuzhouense]MBD1422790.1 hypothetical protein [Sphingobacterium chuzhouense]